MQRATGSARSLPSCWPALLWLQAALVVAGLAATSGGQPPGAKLTDLLLAGRASQWHQVRGLQELMRSVAGSGPSAPAELDPSGDYKCAQHCHCSPVGPAGRPQARHAGQPIMMARCESSQFADILTIDRRTHIIQILLTAQQQEPANANNYNKQLPPTTVPTAQAFRMPRLVQFYQLRELVVVDLRLEVCDSEVFKRGQRLRRLRLNRNQLARLSKLCFRHLDKLVELSLDHNQLAELESALFSGLNSLRMLSLAHNRLEQLAAHQFVNLSRLVTLNLAGNQFKSLNLHLLEPMHASLRVLVLADNEIKTFTFAPSVDIGNATKSGSLAGDKTLPGLAAKIGASTGPQATKHNSINNSNYTSSASSSTTTTITSSSSITTTTTTTASPQTASTQPWSALTFKALVRLDVGQNRLERVKQLHLHRFVNLRYLSVRANRLASIRDKAFNGLRLVELDLAHNRLQAVSRCAFCNATIKRLVLSNNNVSLSSPGLGAAALAASSMAAAGLADPGGVLAPGSAPASSLLLGHSVLGPLYAHLHFLDLSNNELVGQQLEMLLEPMVKLEYLQLAGTGLDRSLPAPNLFRNLRGLRYLNLSHNALDAIVAETLEPLASLEVFDLSHNKLSELDESFLVSLDELPSLRLVSLAGNPWYCSQCKVAHLHDWALRSAIYNATCLVPRGLQRGISDTSGLTTDIGASGADTMDSDSDELASSNGNRLTDQPSSGSNATKYELEPWLLVDDEPEFELELATGPPTGVDADTYTLVESPSPAPPSLTTPLLSGATKTHSMQATAGLAARFSSPPSGEPNFAQLSAMLEALAELATGAPKLQLQPDDYCLRCEFPHELAAYELQDLSANDLKFCANNAPRFSASEPRLGLTLALVIIGALFCVIVAVVIVYRRKNKIEYYDTAEDDERPATSTSGRQSGAKRTRLSVSSDAEQQYGDATDYSSPPASHSADSRSHDDDDDEDVEDEDEDDVENEDADDEEHLDYVDDLTHSTSIHETSKTRLRETEPVHEPVHKRQSMHEEEEEEEELDDDEDEDEEEDAVEDESDDDDELDDHHLDDLQPIPAPEEFSVTDDRSSRRRNIEPARPLSQAPQRVPKTPSSTPVSARHSTEREPSSASARTPSERSRTGAPSDHSRSSAAAAAAGVAASRRKPRSVAVLKASSTRASSAASSAVAQPVRRAGTMPANAAAKVRRVSPARRVPTMPSAGTLIDDATSADSLDMDALASYLAAEPVDLVDQPDEQQSGPSTATSYPATNMARQQRQRSQDSSQHHSRSGRHQQVQPTLACEPATEPSSSGPSGPVVSRGGNLAVSHDDMDEFRLAGNSLSLGRANEAGADQDDNYDDYDDFDDPEEALNEEELADGEPAPSGSRKNLSTSGRAGWQARGRLKASTSTHSALTQTSATAD